MLAATRIPLPHLLGASGLTLSRSYPAGDRVKINQEGHAGQTATNRLKKAEFFGFDIFFVPFGVNFLSDSCALFPASAAHPDPPDFKPRASPTPRQGNIV